MRPTNTMHSDPLETLVMPRSLRVVMLVMLATSLATAVFAQPHPNIAADLETLDQNSTADVIVQYSHAPVAQQHHKVVSRGGIPPRSLAKVRLCPPKTGRFLMTQ